MERVAFLKMARNNSTSGLYSEDLLNAYYKQMQTQFFNSSSKSVSESAGLFHINYNSKVFALLTALEMCQRKITVTHFSKSVLELSHQK